MKSSGQVRLRITGWEGHRHIVSRGHTHMPMFTAGGTSPCSNAGSCIFSSHITTGLEIRSGEITLVKWSRRQYGTQPRIKRKLGPA